MADHTIKTKQQKTDFTGHFECDSGEIRHNSYFLHYRFLCEQNINILQQMIKSICSSLTAGLIDKDCCLFHFQSIGHFGFNIRNANADH